MYGEDIILNDQELKVINDTEFLKIKQTATEKITLLFSGAKKEMKNIIHQHNYIFPEGTDVTNGNISKGENYQQLPYIVMDFPKLFEKNNACSFRTMFWWGNDFSCTLHLSGESLDKYRENLANNFKQLRDKGYYICINKSPWEYHFGRDNYLPFKEFEDFQLQDMFERRSFIKISRRINLLRWDGLIKFTKETFEQTMACLHGGEMPSDLPLEDF